jgi:hypothetical protein
MAAAMASAPPGERTLEDNVLIFCNDAKRV